MRRPFVWLPLLAALLAGVATPFWLLPACQGLVEKNFSLNLSLCKSTFRAAPSLNYRHIVPSGETGSNIPFSELVDVREFNRIDLDLSADHAFPLLKLVLTDNDSRPVTPSVEKPTPHAAIVAQQHPLRNPASRPHSKLSHTPTVCDQTKGARV
jgi:hypothetical protein